MFPLQMTGTSVLPVPHCVVLVLQHTGASAYTKTETRAPGHSSSFIRNNLKSGIMAVRPLCPQSPFPPLLFHIHPELHVVDHLHSFTFTLGHTSLQALIPQVQRHSYKVEAAAAVEDLVTSRRGTRKAGVFVRATSPPLWPNTRRTSHGPTSRGRIGRSGQSGSSLARLTNRSVAEHFMTCPSKTRSAHHHCHSAFCTRGHCIRKKQVVMNVVRVEKGWV